MKKCTDEEIVTALLKAGSIRGAAKELGVTSQAITNRLQNPKLKADFEAAKTSQLTEVCNTMTAVLTSAVQTLVTVMNDQDTPQTVKVSAADSLLRHGLRYVEVAELERRIAALEEGDNS